MRERRCDVCCAVIPPNRDFYVVTITQSADVKGRGLVAVSTGPEEYDVCVGCLTIHFGAMRHGTPRPPTMIELP